MDDGIWKLEYGIWNVESDMDSAGDCCSKISRCIFDAQGIGFIWDADRIEGRALARPEDSSIYIYNMFDIFIYMFLLYISSCLHPPTVPTIDLLSDKLVLWVSCVFYYGVPGTPFWEAWQLHFGVLGVDFGALGHHFGDPEVPKDTQQDTLGAGFGFWSFFNGFWKSLGTNFGVILTTFS